MANLSFLLQYFLKPRTTGAILPSSRFLAQKMVKNIDFDNAKCIVEYGPGTGVFTEKILTKRQQNTQLILIERNESFCEKLKQKYKNHPNLQIVNDSAENIDKHLKNNGFDQADFIVSGLPFASLPQETSQRILQKTKEHLSPNGFFITFQYTLLKKGIFLEFFKISEINRELRNIPPAHVLTLKI
jgi:phospholipid N-methyltransferase